MSSNLNYIQNTEPMAGAGGGYSDTLNRALRNLLSFSGYNPDATTFPGLAGPVYNVVAFGAATTNTPAQNVTAINAAATAAGTDGLLFFPPGTTFAIDNTLTFLGPVMGVGAALTFSGSADAIRIGATKPGGGGIPFVQNATIILPRITHAGKISAGWAQASVVNSVGVRVRHTYNSRITIPYVSGFASGLVFYGEDSDGCDYNTIFIGHLYNNKVNLKLDSASNTSWTNENVFIGGRLVHDPLEGTNVAGTRQIQILGATGTTDILNNHRFFGLSIEGAVPEYHVETKGQQGLWDHCRWESSGSPKFLSNGTTAIDNWVRGGYDSHRIVFTTSGGGSQPRVDSRDGSTLGAAPAGSVVKWANHNSNASAMMRGYNAGTDLFGASIDTNWTWELTALGLSGKQTGDLVAAKRLFLDPTTGVGTFKGVVAGLDSGLTPSLDTSGRNFNINNASLVTFSGGAYALVHVMDTNTGNSAVVLVMGGAGTVIAQNANFSGVSGNAGTYNVYATGGNLVIQNNRGATANIKAFVFKLQ